MTRQDEAMTSPFSRFINAEGRLDVSVGPTPPPGSVLSRRWLVGHPLGLNVEVLELPNGWMICKECHDGTGSCEHIRAVQTKGR